VKLTHNFYVNVESFYELEMPDLPSPPRFYAMNYTGMFLNTAGSCISMWLMMIGADLFLTLLLRLRSNRIFMINKIRDSIRNSYPIKLWISTCVEFFYAALLQFRVPVFDDLITRVSWGIALSVTVMIVLFPFYCYIVISKDRKTKLNMPLFTEYGEKNKRNRYFIIAYIAKRLLSALAITTLYYIPPLQISCLIVIDLLYLGMLGLIRPRDNGRDNIYDLLQQLVTFTVNCLISVFPSDHDEKFQERIALVIIILILGIVLVQAGRIFLEQFEMIKEVIKKASKKAVPKKTLKRVKKISTKFS